MMMPMACPVRPYSESSEFPSVRSNVLTARPGCRAAGPCGFVDVGPFVHGVPSTRKSADRASVPPCLRTPRQVAGRPIGMEGALVSIHGNAARERRRWANTEITRKENNHVATGSAVPDYRDYHRRPGI